MLKRRVVKQASYAGGCFVLVVAAVVAVSFMVTRPRVVSQASPTPIPYQPVIVEEVDVVTHGTTADVVARVRNPNPRAGVSEYTVTLQLFNNADQPFHEQVTTTYVLPGSIQYIAALDVPLAQPLQRVEVVPPDSPQFQELPHALDVPTFASFPRQRTTRDVGGRTIEEQKWVVRNTSTFGFQRVEVVAVAYAADNRVVGVGSTLAGALAVGEQREITLQWPALAQSATRVTLFPSTNIFLEENIIRTLGDPGSLQ